MTALHVGVDVDDVIFPWYERAHVACMIAGITGGVDPTTWSPHEEYGCSEKDWHDVLEAATLDGSLLSGDPYPGSVEALQRLEGAGHRIHLVTARGFLAQGHLIRKQTIDWLHEHKVPHDTLTFSKDKTLVRADVFIDDSTRNVEALERAGVRTFMLSRPHNSRSTTYSPRVDSLSEFVDIILSEDAARARGHITPYRRARATVLPVIPLHLGG